MKVLRTIALFSCALLSALFVPSAHAQVSVQDQGVTQFCGNWGWNGAYTCFGVSGYLVKDDTEQDPNHDIYTIVVRAWDTVNDGHKIAEVDLQTYTYYNANLDKYDPQA